MFEIKKGNDAIFRVSLQHASLSNQLGEAVEGFSFAEHGVTEEGVRAFIICPEGREHPAPFRFYGNNVLLVELPAEYQHALGDYVLELQINTPEALLHDGKLLRTLRSPLCRIVPTDAQSPEALHEGLELVLSPGILPIKGEKGDTGERGEQGPQGDKGDAGERGERGEQGPKGEKGDTGNPFRFEDLSEQEQRDMATALQGLMQLPQANDTEHSAIGTELEALKESLQEFFEKGGRQILELRVGNNERKIENIWKDLDKYSRILGKFDNLEAFASENEIKQDVRLLKNKVDALMEPKQDFQLNLAAQAMRKGGPLGAAGLAEKTIECLWGLFEDVDAEYERIFDEKPSFDTMPLSTYNDVRNKLQMTADGMERMPLYPYMSTPLCWEDLLGFTYKLRGLINKKHQEQQTELEALPLDKLKNTGRKGYTLKHGEGALTMLNAYTIVGMVNKIEQQGTQFNPFDVVDAGIAQAMMSVGDTETEGPQLFEAWITMRDVLPFFVQLLAINQNKEKRIAALEKSLEELKGAQQPEPSTSDEEEDDLPEEEN